MANNIQRYGFRLMGSLYGNMPKPIRVRVASAYQGADKNSANCDLGPGDVLKEVSDGTVALAAGTDAFLYVCVGVGQYWNGTVMTNNKVLPGGQGAYSTNLDRETWLWAVPVNGNIFEVDCGTAAGTATQAGYTTLIHNNVNHANNGDTTAVRANPQLDAANAATTNTLQWRILDISPTQENQDFTGLYVKLLVTANVSQAAAGFAGTATGV
jgi:hypothetical protein